MKRLSVNVENKWCAHLRGSEVRELVVDLTGRPPIWSPTSRTWIVTERTARDVMAVAESRGYDVQIGSDPGGGRW